MVSRNSFINWYFLLPLKLPRKRRTLSAIGWATLELIRLIASLRKIVSKSRESCEICTIKIINNDEEKVRNNINNKPLFGAVCRYTINHKFLYNPIGGEILLKLSKDSKNK